MGQRVSAVGLSDTVFAYRKNDRPREAKVDGAFHSVCTMESFCCINLWARNESVEIETDEAQRRCAGVTDYQPGRGALTPGISPSRSRFRSPRIRQPCRDMGRDKLAKLSEETGLSHHSLDGVREFRGCIRCFEHRQQHDELSSPAIIM